VAKTINDTLTKITDGDTDLEYVSKQFTDATANDLTSANSTWTNLDKQLSIKDLYNHETDSGLSPIDLYDGTQTKGDAKNILYHGTGASAGSNLGGFFTGKDGIKRYVKFYDDAAQVYGEVLTNNIYHDLGLNSPESQYFSNEQFTGIPESGKPAFASVIVPNVGTLADVGLTQDLAHKILDGFAADCLVANWDTLGIDNKNVVITNEGQVCRIDNGGSMLNRAMGSRKPQELLNKCTELEAFADPNKNAKYSELFKITGLKSAADLGDRLVQQVHDILTLVTEAGGWEEYLNMKVPDLKGPDHDEMVAMLYHKTKILLDYVKQMKGKK